MTRLRSLVALATLSTWWVAGSALAQETTDAPALACDEGRVRLAAGRCCWPGQRWSDERGRCEGAPRCPDGLVEHGDACVAPAHAVSVPTLAEGASSTAPPAYAIAPGAYAAGHATREEATTEGWPDAGDAPLARPTHRVVVSRGEDEGLIAAAFVVFDVGWVLGWLGAVLSEATGCRTFTPFGSASTGCDAWPWAFIPIGGGMAAGMAAISRGNGFAFGFGIPSVILQGIGAIMSIIAFANETTELVLQPMRLGGSLSASLAIGAESSDAGLTFGLTF